MRVGKIAHQYLSDYAAKQNVDKTFGIYKNPKDKQYYIGNTPIDVRENNLIVGVKEYEGTGTLYMVWFVGTYNQQTTRYRLKRNWCRNYFFYRRQVS